MMPKYEIWYSTYRLFDISNDLPRAKTIAGQLHDGHVIREHDRAVLSDDGIWSTPEE